MQWSIRRRNFGFAAAIGMAIVVVVGGAIIWSARQAGAERLLGGAVLSNGAGEMVGRATFAQAGRAVRVEVTVEGLSPGFHGFHIHAVGLCEAGGGFASAGGHVNPGGHNHAEHAGDQPSLYVMADGTGALSFLTDRASVDELLGGEPRADRARDAGQLREHPGALCPGGPRCDDARHRRCGRAHRLRGDRGGGSVSA